MTRPTYDEQRAVRVISYGALLRWFQARGYPVWRTSIEQFRTGGRIPQIPAVEFDAALEELSR